VKSVGRRFDDGRPAGVGARRNQPPQRRKSAALAFFMFFTRTTTSWLRMPSSARPVPDLRDTAGEMRLTTPRRPCSEIRRASIPRGPRQGWGAYTGDVTTIHPSREVWTCTQLCVVPRDAPVSARAPATRERRCVGRGRVPHPGPALTGARQIVWDAHGLIRANGGMDHRGKPLLAANRSLSAMPVGCNVQE
jgi:hypothetical protein